MAADAASAVPSDDHLANDALDDKLAAAGIVGTDANAKEILERIKKSNSRKK